MVFEPFDEPKRWVDTNGKDVLDHNDQDRIRELLLGHKVEKVVKGDNDYLVLDNGAALLLVPNVGDCACSNGDYELTELNGVDNIITNVEFDYEGDGYYMGAYRIFVYADNEKINLAEFSGYSEGGYYGTGFRIYVREAVDANTITKE